MKFKIITYYPSLKSPIMLKSENQVCTLSDIGGMLASIFPPVSWILYQQQWPMAAAYNPSNSLPENSANFRITGT